MTTSDRSYFRFMAFAILLSILGFIASVTAESEMKPIPEAKNLITEIWCVEGFKVFYVEKTTNETFQFFQLTRNGGMAPKLMECNGNETRTIP